MAVLGRLVIRTVTFVLGAIPATALAGLAIWISVAAAGEREAICGLLVLSPSAAAGGTFSLWRAAFGPLPIPVVTALGLVSGLFSVIGFRNFRFHVMVLLPARDRFFS
jgi:hypothetical protein